MKKSLFDNVMQYKISAATIYDKGIVDGLAQEKINEAIEPIRKRLDILIHNHVREDIGGTITAIQEFQNLIAAHNKTMEYLAEKVYEANVIIEKIKAEIVKKMEHEKLEVLQHGDFYATLVQKDGKNYLTVR